MKKLEVLEKKGITLVALVITVIILLILAGVSINLIGGSRGIFSKATQAVDLTKYKAAEESVNLAVIASYGSLGKIENNELKKNLLAIEGFENMQSSSGNEIVEEIQNTDFPLNIQITGYEFTIEQTGLVISNFENNTPSNGEENDSGVIDVTEIASLKQQIGILQTEVSSLKNTFSNSNAKSLDRNVDTTISGNIYYMRFGSIVTCWGWIQTKSAYSQHDEITIRNRIA